MQDVQSIKSRAFDGRMRTLFPKTCECGQTFHVPRHAYDQYQHCSLECRYRNSKARTWTTLTCRQCGIAFQRLIGNLKRSKSGIRFCSKHCKDVAQRTEGVKENVMETRRVKAHNWTGNVLGQEHERQCVTPAR